MDFSSVQRGVKNLGGVISKNSPHILTGLGCAGVFTTAILTGRATLKAHTILEREEEYRKEQNKDSYSEPLPPMEVVQLTWKTFVPPVLMGLTSIACIVGANTISANRNAAIAALYSLSETAFREYKDKVVEEVGKTKERAIRDSISQDHINARPVNTSTVIVTGQGDVLCHDAMSKRYFRSSPEKIRQVVADLDDLLRLESWIPLNEFYYRLHMDTCDLGANCGFNPYKGNGRVEIDYNSSLTPEGIPCLEVSAKTYPNPNWIP